jgi:very-short-patch-repair endonuclease
MRTTSRPSIRLQQYAAAHRAQPTFSEAALWQLLRSSRHGVQFRRQVVLCGRFIADLFVPASRLVIEIDGSSHSHRQSADARRDRALQRAGYRVLRIPAELVIHEPAEALRRIRVALGEPA